MLCLRMQYITHANKEEETMSLDWQLYVINNNIQIEVTSHDIAETYIKSNAKMVLKKREVIQVENVA